MDQNEIDNIRKVLQDVALKYPDDSTEAKSIVFVTKALLYIHMTDQLDPFLKKVADWDGTMSTAEESAMLRETFAKRGMEPPDWLKP